jgi:hypothetical protein
VPLGMLGGVEQQAEHGGGQLRLDFSAT